MRITLAKARRAAKALHVDTDVVSVPTLRRGMQVEIEHGRIDARTNVTDNDCLKTAKIALAHLQEFPDYYEQLERMETRLKRKWTGKARRDVFYSARDR